MSKVAYVGKAGEEKLFEKKLVEATHPKEKRKICQTCGNYSKKTKKCAISGNFVAHKHTSKDWIERK